MVKEKCNRNKSWNSERTDLNVPFKNPALVLMSEFSNKRVVLFNFFKKIHVEFWILIGQNVPLTVQW